MKLVMEIEDEVMRKAMKVSSAQSPEEAALSAIKDMSEKHWMKDYYSSTDRLTEEDLKDMIDPDYDLQAIRDASIWPRPKTPAHEAAALSG